MSETWARIVGEVAEVKMDEEELNGSDVGWRGLGAGVVIKGRG